ncbi:MAG: GNAT family N-acetyltransferase [Phaeodactylibacter sp.]|nr:GNAT family N-acetyltransferase [Phaeodactylibacter sp.]MCB9303750.1 GNAT family N-acetyltransferase [Lewinellaceae bacterium]
MFSRIRYPEKMEAEELDAYLAAGWRCMGQAIYISHFMFFPASGGRHAYSTLPTRLPLDGYAFRKSLRRLWRRNERFFQIEVGAPAVFDPEKERVNKRYAALFPSRAIKDAADMLDNGAGGRAFDTREVKLYHQGRLVAFSFFDLGKDSLYSKQGIYDPAFRSYSPGFFTMLVEIAYGMEKGVKYYYPGYVVPGYPEFDYKHRVGELEYYDLPTGGWKTFRELQPMDVPINRMRQQLLLLQATLRQQGIKSSLLDYRLFDIRFYDNRPFPFLEYPVFLLVSSQSADETCPLAVFDPVQNCFTLLNGRFFGIAVNHLEFAEQLLANSSGLCMQPVAAFNILAEGKSLESALSVLKQFALGKSG